MTCCSVLCFFPMKLHSLSKLKKIRAQNKVTTIIPEILNNSLI